jgi:hypothetical protein
MVRIRVVTDLGAIHGQINRTFKRVTIFLSTTIGAIILIQGCVGYLLACIYSIHLFIMTS